MRKTRLYLDQPLQSGTKVSLEEPTARYVRQVLRLKPNTAITLFNGNGGEYSAVVEQSSRSMVSIAIHDWKDRECESALKIELGIGISRGERMDFAIQKAVELGVNLVSPLLTEHSVVQLTDERKQRKLRHWKRITYSACEQSGRNFVPRVDVPQELGKWLENKGGVKFFCDPRSGFTLTEQGRPDETVILLCGPEGGFSKRERSKAIEAGFNPINLGPRILRTETAVLAALTAIQTLWGDMRQPNYG